MTHPEWGLLVVVYLFLGGLGAGALVLSALATFVGRQQRHLRIARAGALAAPVPVLLGTGLLVFDLGRPLFFWKLFTAFEPESPMWIGSWLLVLFSVVSLAHANLHLPESRRVWRPGHAALWRYRLAAAGLPLGIAVGIYTGVLLGAVPARPFWNTPMVAQLFLFSALSTAAALLLALAPRLDAPEDAGSASADLMLLLSADVVLILLELLIITPYIVHGQLAPLAARESLSLILGGPFTTLFWGGVVGLGLLVPLGVEASHLVPALLRHHAIRPHPVLDSVVAVLVLAGGFVLRYVFVYAGQVSAFG
jgi:formate-dependent nitrite reductase membrane component NrfD